MIGPVRRQGDDKQRFFSSRAVKDFSKDPLLVRQEFAEETDINVIMRRVGAGQSVNARPLCFGAVDYDVDLLRFRTSVDYALSVYQGVPAEVREKFQDFSAFVRAVVSGQIKPAAAAEVSSAAEGGEPSPKGAAGSKPEEKPKGEEPPK